MRLIFLQTDQEWTGSTSVMATVAKGLTAGEHEAQLLLPLGSAAIQVAESASVPFAALPERRTTLGLSAELARQFKKRAPDAVFVNSSRDHLLAALVLRRVGRGALVRRLAAGGDPPDDWRSRRADAMVPTRLMYTSETPPSGKAAPSGALVPVRVELGADINDGEAAPGMEARVESDPPVTRIVCVAPSSAIRRATNVVRAVAYLAQRHETLKLRVVGSAAADPDLRVLASALRIGDRVEWEPNPFFEAHTVADAAAGWVIGDHDDAGLGALALMAHGVPVLAMRTSVSAHYVSDGIHGLLFTHLEPPAMAAATSVLLADADRRRAMGEAGRSRVEREFPLTDMLAGFEQAARHGRRAT